MRKNVSAMKMHVFCAGAGLSDYIAIEGLTM